MELLRDGLLEAIRLLFAFDPLVMDAAMRSLWISFTAVTLAGVFGVATGTVLARLRFPGRAIVVLLFRGGMALPTVLIGLVCYAMFSRRGPLGPFDLLYSPWGIVAGEFILALPIIVTLTHGAVSSLDPRVAETARTLGAGRLRRLMTYISEARIAVMLALLTAFARCVTELGIAMMVGGNLKYRTRTLTTATAQESSSGEFARGIAMSLILLVVALLITVAISWLGREKRGTST
jgi:tungstate transport system permease protein